MRFGKFAALHAEVPDDIAAEIMALVATEPPLAALGSRPLHLERYGALLSRGGIFPKQNLGVVYELPKGLGGAHEIRTVDSESDEGKRLCESLTADGMPDGLLEMGFHDVGEFWDPWCVAMHDGVPVSICFAARLSGAGADAGVATAKAMRGNGFAAAATAGWTRLKALQSRALFYSTDQTNLSSQRVIARLGLRLIGASLRID